MANSPSDRGPVTATDPPTMVAKVTVVGFGRALIGSTAVEIPRASNLWSRVDLIVTTTDRQRAYVVHGRPGLVPTCPAVPQVVHGRPVRPLAYVRVPARTRVITSDLIELVDRPTEELA